MEMKMIKSVVKWGAKKAIQSYAKKEIREASDIIDEIFNKSSRFPWDAKELNRGEDEMVRKSIEKWRQEKEDEFQSNQSKLTGQTHIKPKFNQTPITEEPYYKKQTREQKAKEENHQNILKLIESHNNPKEDILYKHPSQITERELKDSMKYSGYEISDSDLKKRFNAKTTDWFEHYYGKESLDYDATGRMKTPDTKTPFPTDITEPRTKDNIPLSQAFKEAAETTANLGVKSLQKGLNELYKDNYKKPLLKEDNILGAKTTSRMKEALATKGINSVNQSIKLGGFSNMLEEHRKQNIDQQTLNTTMTAIRPQDGGIFLQQNLNKLGAGLKEDNYIGPKTTSAFNQVKDDNEDALNRHARENIAKEIQKTKEMEAREQQREFEREEKEREEEQERQQREREKERLAEEQEEEAQSLGTTSPKGQGMLR